MIAGLYRPGRIAACTALALAAKAPRPFLALGTLLFSIDRVWLSGTALAMILVLYRVARLPIAAVAAQLRPRPLGSSRCCFWPSSG